MDAPLHVAHNPGARRYEVRVGLFLAVADYEIQGAHMILTHTLVPPELRGQGIAEKLVRAALADARAGGLKVVPACSYVARFIAQHPEFSDLTS